LLFYLKSSHIPYDLESQKEKGEAEVNRNLWVRILGVLMVGFFALAGSEGAMAIEEARYTVVEKEGGFEIRQYEGHIVAETFAEGDFEEVGKAAFRRLYDYISGNNRKKQEIAMTAPVTQEPDSQKIAMTAPVGQEPADGRWRITFVMPVEYSMETLPEPMDPEVVLREEPGRLMAALRYSGTWSRKRYMERELELREWIETRGLQPLGEPVFARYNSPFMPWFLRRNEVLIPVQR
jgi:hypothetical protein